MFHWLFIIVLQPVTIVHNLGHCLRLKPRLVKFDYILVVSNVAECRMREDDEDGALHHDDAGRNMHSGSCGPYVQLDTPRYSCFLFF